MLKERLYVFAVVVVQKLFLIYPHFLSLFLGFLGSLGFSLIFIGFPWVLLGFLGSLRELKEAPGSLRELSGSQ